MAGAAEASRARPKGRGLTPKPPSYYLRSHRGNYKDCIRCSKMNSLVQRVVQNLGEMLADPDNGTPGPPQAATFFANDAPKWRRRHEDWVPVPYPDCSAMFFSRQDPFTRPQKY